MALTPLRVIWRRRALERSCGWTRAQLEEHQQRRMVALRRYVQERSPFYRRYHRGLEHAPLDRLPILTKATMMEHFDDLVTDRAVRLADAERFLRRSRDDEWFQGRYVVLSTSGSTGHRGIFVYDRDEWLTALAMISRPFVWAGIVKGWGWPPRTATIASTLPSHYSARASSSLTSRLFPALRLDATDALATLVHRLNHWQPEVLATYPSVLKPLAEEQIAGRLRVQPHTIATSAEVLTEETRRRVHEAWGIRVLDTYGATEYAPIAAECDFGRRHLLEDGAIIEIVDDRGRPVPAGTSGSRLLLTIFDRHTQPLIRYEISDMVQAVDGSCACGRPFAVIGTIDGRTEEVLYFHRRDGDQPVPVPPVVFHQVLEAIPASGWQIQQDGDGLVVSLTGLEDASIREQLASSLQDVLDRRGAKVESIRVRIVEALQRGPTGKAPLILARTRK